MRGAIAISYVLAALYAVLGACLFAAPHWAAGQFAWKVSPLVTMTIGGWCLGNMCAAFLVAHRRLVAEVRSVALYVVLFGILESAVVWSFRGLLQLHARPLAWLYLAALVLSWALAAMLLSGWTNLSRRNELTAPQRSAVDTVLAALFIIVVAFLGLYGLFVPPGGRGLNGTVFPEVLTFFSLRSFGAFYLSLALATVPVLLSGRRSDFLSHSFGLDGLIVFITIAAAAFPEVWHFDQHRLQLLYPGLYLLVGFGTAIYLVRYGTGTRR